VDFTNHQCRPVIHRRVGRSVLRRLLKTKGENLATHEDIDKLVDQVKVVTATTEQIKTEISDAAWNRQKRWELKREVLFEAAKRITEVDEALVAFDNEKWGHAIVGFDEVTPSGGYHLRERDFGRT
jgi:hypothetical protein